MYIYDHICKMLYRKFRSVSSFTTTVLLSFVQKRNTCIYTNNFFCHSFTINIRPQQNHQHQNQEQQKEYYFGRTFITTTIRQQQQQPSSSKIRVGKSIMSTTMTTTSVDNNNNSILNDKNIDSNGTSTSINTKRKIAIGQLCSTSNKLINLINIAKCAAWATNQHHDDDNCCMLFLPECFGFIGSNATDTINNAESIITTVPIDFNNNNNQQNTSSDNEQQPQQQAVQEEVRNDPSINKILESTIDKYSINDTDVHLDSDNDIPLELFETKISLVAGLQLIAQKCNIWISAGGMHVTGAPPKIVVSDTTSTNDNDIDNNILQQEQQQQQRVYNTHIILDNNGIIQCMYRKIHLFDVSIPGKVTLTESTTTAPGTELVICNSPIGCLGVTVCYDLRFPETYIALLQMGAQIMLVPSAFTVPTGTAHWHTLLRARAIENQCYVIAAAQYGKHNEKRESYGHSIVVDPWGTIIVDAGGVDGPGTTTTTSTTISQQKQNDKDNNDVAPHPPSIVTCTIDLNHVQSVRERMPIQIHRENAKGVLN